MIELEIKQSRKKENQLFAITNLQRKFDKLLFFYLFIWVGNFSKIMEELIYNIQQIINILRKRGNEAHLFFDNILNQLMNSDDSAIELLLKSSAIVQYADFNDNEEYIYNKIWNIANEIRISTHGME